MALREAIFVGTLLNYHSFIPATTLDASLGSTLSTAAVSAPGLSRRFQQINVRNRGRASGFKVCAFPDWPLMAVLVEHLEGQRDFHSYKSIWHLSDKAIKNVYSFYIMFTCWGCLFFGSTKDPFYDSEGYRKDGGDGMGNWIYEKQADIEESARAELWREELIEEIEQKVGGLKELEEAGKK